MTWRPILAAVEVQPAVWSMRDQAGEYGRVELRRVAGNELRYRCEFRGVLIGWATTLDTLADGTVPRLSRRQPPLIPGRSSPPRGRSTHGTSSR
ncbi:hypothetical protein [Microbacterium telephonicum]|uniref:Uncharacterized protein n=1 Tax=Microbacterium telephonicum TaxID=1714841 RepID=A0A498BUT2_9MICO|nr:hypothetical protein [Microbacterium telephonicum]RLK47603.1 hypothetical protein C7474_2195 [Microbacterium telephonicum]